MNPFYAIVAARADFRCEYCHAPQNAFNFGFEVEHIYPRSAGGDNSHDNLALSCASCNGFKSDAVTGRDETEAELVSFFHPRRDLWEQHFAFDAELNQVIGLTAVGRVTVARLKMNSLFQVRARLHWISMGLYP